MDSISNWADALRPISSEARSHQRYEQEQEAINRWTSMAARLLKCERVDVSQDRRKASQGGGRPTAGSSVLVVSFPVCKSAWVKEIWALGEPGRIWSTGETATLSDLATALALELDLIAERQDHFVVEDRLRFTEQIYRALAEANSQIIWVSDATGGMVRPCTTWQAFTGQRVEEVVGLGCLAAVHPDDQEPLRVNWQRAKDQPAKMLLEYRLRHHSGEWHWLSENAVPLYDSEDTLIGWAGTSVDVQEQRQHQQQLAQNEARFRALVEASSEIVWTGDTHGNMVGDSPSWREFTGGSIEQWQSHGWLEFIHPDDQQMASKLWQQVVNAKQPGCIEYRLKRRDGQWRWIVERCVPYQALVGEHEGWVGMSTDITNTKLASIALAEREQHLSLALKAARMAAWSVDLESNALTINGQGDFLPGIRGIGDRLETLLGKMSKADASEFSKLIAEAQLNDETFHFEFRPINAKELCWIGIEGHLSLNQAGQKRVLRGVMRDITDTKLADERKNLLVGEIAHRGKNLLAVVQSIASSTLADDASSSPIQKKFLDRLASLARSHTLLSVKDWVGVPLDEIVKLEFGCLLDRVTINVAPVILNPSSAQNCSLVLHELVTNSMKYGALSVREGHVTVSGLLEMNEENEECVMFNWVESKGPLVTPPTRRGFGSTLLRRMVDSFDAPGTIDYKPEGLCVQVAMPLNMIRPTPDVFGHATIM